MIRISVNFALLLIDDFTGREIPEDGFRFWINGQKAAPLKKPEGLYVFTGQSGNEWLLCVEGTHYSKRAVTVRKDTLDIQSPIVELRLFRRENLHFSDCEQITGIHKPGKTIFALCRDAPLLKLHSVEKPLGTRSKITLIGYTVRSLVRCRFCIGTGKNREMFEIVAKESDGSYLCDRQFLYKHKEGEPLLRAFGTACNDEGRFSIPIEKGIKDNVETIEEYSEEVRQWGCLLQTAPN
ncbi:MAG: hypothetical protein RSF00_03200 [Oscillospiraceae bacterium]